MRDIYLIDFENVASEGLSGITYLTEDDQVIIFYSANSNRLTMKMHILIGKSVCDRQYIEATVGGKNALDHQISTWLGYLIGTQAADRNYYIVSKDQGYKHVASFWNGTPMKPHIRCIDSIRSASRADRRRVTHQVLSAEVAAVEASILKEQASAEDEALREAAQAAEAERLQTEVSVEETPSVESPTVAENLNSEPEAVIAEPAEDVTPIVETPVTENEDASMVPEAEAFEGPTVETAEVQEADNSDVVSAAADSTETPVEVSAEESVAETSIPVFEAKADHTEAAPEETPAQDITEEATAPAPSPEEIAAALAQQDAEELEALAEAQTQTPRNGRNRNRNRRSKSRSRSNQTENTAETTETASAESSVGSDSKAEKPEQSEKPEKTEKTEKRGNRSRSQRQRRNDRSEKAEKPEKTEKTEKPEKPETADTAEKADTTEKKPVKNPNKNGKKEKDEQTATPQQQEKPAKSTPRNDALSALLKSYPTLSEAHLNELISAGKKQVLCNHLRKQLGQEKGLALYNEIKRTVMR